MNDLKRQFSILSVQIWPIKNSLYYCVFRLKVTSNCVKVIKEFSLVKKTQCARPRFSLT
jgi:hypothetical protein